MRHSKRNKKIGHKSSSKPTRKCLADTLEGINYELDGIVRNNTYGERDGNFQCPGYDILSPGNPAETARTAIALALHFRATDPGGWGPALNPEPEVRRMVDWAWKLMPQKDIALIKRHSPSKFRSLLNHWLFNSRCRDFTHEVGN